MREEEDLWRNILPRLALTYDFLLEGLFAISALDIVASAICADPSPFIHMALESYHKSSAMFRQRLVEITPEHCHVFFACSVLVLAVNVLIPKYAPNALESASAPLEAVQTFFGLSRGARQVAIVFDDAFSQHLPYTEAVRKILQSPPAVVDEGEREAIRVLHNINDRLSERGIGLSKSRKTRSSHEMYRSAIALLEIYYAEDCKGRVTGLCLSAPSKTGDDFTAAMDKSEPLAMLVLMHWAVVLERSSDRLWWTKSLGRGLIQQVSALLQGSILWGLPDVPEHIAWVERQVGLGFEDGKNV